MNLGVDKLESSAKYFFTALTFFACGIVQGAPCDISIPKLGQSEFDRAGFVEFPDGRQITVVGHNHGSRNAFSVLREARSEAEIKTTYKQVLNDNVESVREGRQDLDFLKSQLKNKPLVAVESTKKVAAENDDILSQSFPILVKRARSAGFSENEVTSLVLLPGGAPHALKWMNSRSVDKFDLVGVESGVAMEAEASADTHFDSVKVVVDDPIHGETTGLARGILETIRKLRREGVLAEQGARNQLRAEISDLVKNRFPEQKRAMVREFLEAGLKAEEAGISRDVASAANLVELKVSVVLFVGKSHSKTILNLLKKACDHESSAPSSNPVRSGDVQR